MRNNRWMIVLGRSYLLLHIQLQPQKDKALKVNPSVKPICDKCKVIRRNGVVMVICENPRHKQRQG